MLRNRMRTPRYGYTPNFTNNQYINDYNTFLSQLNLDKGDKSVALTPEEWANGYPLYAFKTTDGPIGPGLKLHVRAFLLVSCDFQSALRNSTTKASK